VRDRPVRDTPKPYDRDLERLSEFWGRCISCAASATAAKARNGGARRRPIDAEAPSGNRHTRLMAVSLMPAL
jgi:hypothetical protein